MYIVGGSIPEICDDKVYNTCTVWDPDGNLIAKHRKVPTIYILEDFIVHIAGR